MNQELISYGMYEIDTLREIKDTVMNLNNRTMPVERELLHKTLYSDMGQVQNYKYSVIYGRQAMLCLMTISKEYLCIYEIMAF